MKIFELTNKEIQKRKKAIQIKVEEHISKNVPVILKSKLNDPIVKVSWFSVYSQSDSPASQLYWSVAKNRSGRFFVWSSVLNKWCDLGGPNGKDNPHEVKDSSGHVIEVVDYELDPYKVFSTKEELFSNVPHGQAGDMYLIGAKNRLIDFLRLNLYSQFSVGFNSGPEQYLPGIARIACGELGFYSFNYAEMKGGEISKLAKYMNLLYRCKDIIFGNDFDFDSDLNGLTYTELESILSDGYNKFKEEENLKLSNFIKDNDGHKYKIISIDDRPSPQAGYVPIGSGKNILHKLSQYVDWCICNDDSEFSQYTGNGGKFYICLRDDFKAIKKPENKNDDSLDEYALSMISVLVGTDGYPDLITTRWNHNYGGENNKGLWRASQLQKILNVEYFSVFKPRTREELEQSHLYESKSISAQDQVHNKVNAGIMDGVCAGECALEESNESEGKNTAIQKLMTSIANFMANEGLNVKPFPTVELNWDEQDGVFIKTGYYSPEEKKIVVFCKDRHIKDILRSFSHEMIHHIQNLDGENLDFTNSDGLESNKKLEQIEGDAFLRGNLYFRKWTERNDGIKRKELNESNKKPVFNDEGKLVPEKCDKCGAKIGVYICGEPIYKCTKCGKYYGTMPFTLNEDKEIEEYLEPDEVDLSSFNIKHNLNPKFWKDERLDSRIRMKLLDIADDFIDFLNVDWIDPEDIVITGSLANFNWDKQFSDIDIHVIYDFKKIDDNFDFVNDYFYSKKKLWNDEHKNLTIYGFPVEMYVEDINNDRCSTGVYSLESDEWIEEPNRKTLASSKINKSLICKIVSIYTKKIDKLSNEYEQSGQDNYKLEKINKKALDLFDEIKKMRKESLSKSKKEISNGNIIFKTLRRIEYIDKLTNIIQNSYNELNSIDE